MVWYEMATEIAPLAPLSLPETRPGPIGSPFTALSDVVMVRAFEKLPGALALTITDRPSGTHLYLLLETADLEDEAYERFVAARQRLGWYTFDMSCLTESDAANIEISESARVYRLQ